MFIEADLRYIEQVWESKNCLKFCLYQKIITVLLSYAVVCHTFRSASDLYYSKYGILIIDKT